MNKSKVTRYPSETSDLPNNSPGLPNNPDEWTGC